MNKLKMNKALYENYNVGCLAHFQYFHKSNSDI